MAAFTIIYGIRDGKNSKSSFEINLPQSLSLPNVTEFALDMIPFVNALITGGIVSLGIAISLDDQLPVGVSAASPDSDVEEGAKFQFITNDGYYTSLRLPTFDEQFIVPGTRQVDPLDAAVIAFNTAMLIGLGVGAGGATNASPSDKREDDITGISFEREDFVKSRA